VSLEYSVDDPKSDFNVFCKYLDELERILMEEKKAELAVDDPKCIESYAVEMEKQFEEDMRTYNGIRIAGIYCE
jgi:hypothetical protein